MFLSIYKHTTVVLSSYLYNFFTRVTVVDH